MKVKGDFHTIRGFRATSGVKRQKDSQKGKATITELSDTSRRSFSYDVTLLAAGIYLCLFFRHETCTSRNTHD